MNALLEIVRAEEEGHQDRALIFFAQRAAYYKREGTLHCGTCGKTPIPEEERTFNVNMKCGHPWSGLMWRRKER